MISQPETSPSPASILQAFLEKANQQKIHFNIKQRDLPCIEDFTDEDGIVSLPEDIGPLLQQSHANGRYSEADWWVSTITRELERLEALGAVPSKPEKLVKSTGCEYCVDGLQADGETPCPACSEPSAKIERLEIELAEARGARVLADRGRRTQTELTAYWKRRAKAAELQTAECFAGQRDSEAVYRFLAIGEIVLPGDESVSDDGASWEPVMNVAIGYPVARIYKTIRRRLAPVTSPDQGGEAIDRDRETAALVVLRRAGIEPDLQSLLVQGSPSRGIAPGALKKAIDAALASTWRDARSAPQDPAGKADDPADRQGDAAEALEAILKASSLDRLVCRADAATMARFAEIHQHAGAALGRMAEASDHRDRELGRLRRLATDRAYLMQAYHDMLGPKGREVAALWREKGVTRVHFDWGPDGLARAGEDRAAIILDLEKASCRLVADGEIDGDAGE